MVYSARAAWEQLTKIIGGKYYEIINERSLRRYRYV
jgi:hypothetical protein